MFLHINEVNYLGDYRLRLLRHGEGWWEALY
jgi:hypothetical protein